MHVVDNDDGRVDHRADGYRDAAQRHDVGRQPLLRHRDEGQQDRDRQGHDHHQCRAQVHQEHDDHQRHDQHFLGQRGRQRIDGLLDQGRAVVDRHDLHAVRQCRLHLGNPRLDPLDHAQRVLAVTHHHHAADREPLAVEFGGAALHRRAELNLGHVRDPHRLAALAGAQHDVFQVLLRAHVAAAAHELLVAGDLQHPAADVVVRAAHRLDHLLQRDAIRRQAVRVQVDLVFLLVAAHRGDLGHALDRLQRVAQVEVLQAAQLGEVGVAAAVHQRVLVDPADAGGIRSQGRRDALGQLLGRRVQVFQYP